MNHPRREVLARSRLARNQHTAIGRPDTLKRLRTAGVAVEGGIFNAVPQRTRTSYGYGYTNVQEYLST